MSGFADHFSRDSAGYAKFRPTYPEALFPWLAELPARRSVAWDCGTGTGQAALPLARCFRRVIATDPSRTQLSAAKREPGVHFVAAPAEAAPIARGRVDLVTVAQAFHWIDPERFYSEIERVLAPGGALAIWTYGILRTTPDIEPIVTTFYRETVGPYWPPARVHVEEGYRRVRIPIAEVPAPPFAIEGDLSLPALLGYIGTWSAVGRFQKETGRDPIPELAEQLAAVWGDPSRTRRVDWPLSIRAGRWTRRGGRPG